MRILSLTAGAARMFCGSCLRDNALARELLRLGHDVSLTPIYTPTRTDEPNASAGGKVLFGGISVYLQQRSRLFRHTPAFLDRIWDSSWALRAAARSSLSVDPTQLGALTVAMLQGEGGPLDKEFQKLEGWLRRQPAPDVINLPNTLLIAMAPAIRKVYRGPIVVTLQGEDLFLDALPQPYRAKALGWIGQHSRQADAFIATSGFYATHMQRFLGLPEEKVSVVPLGLDTSEGSDFAPDRMPPRRTQENLFRCGYLARIAPEKGLGLLAEAWIGFRKQADVAARLEVAGYLAPEHRKFLESVIARLRQAGLEKEFSYHGEVDRAGKLAFLRSLDVFSVPAMYDEPKGLYVLEAMAAGVPVVQPERGAFPEHLARCPGGLLFDSGQPQALAEMLIRLLREPELRRSLGRRGEQSVRANATLRGMAEATLQVYRAAAERAREAATPVR